MPPSLTIVTGWLGDGGGGGGGVGGDEVFGASGGDGGGGLAGLGTLGGGMTVAICTPQQAAWGAVLSAVLVAVGFTNCLSREQATRAVGSLQQRCLHPSNALP